MQIKCKCGNVMQGKGREGAQVKGGKGVKDRKGRFGKVNSLRHRKANGSETK